MELCGEEKWRMAKKESWKASASSSSSPAPARERLARAAARRSFAGRCGSLVKEQRARFYIMRRCVAMLICWRDLA
ncbi:hypothetical protein AXF42_Ash008197 [Apostasia shenzhenica]|uniref:ROTUNDIFOLIA like 8 n=1 Tax=Apostasia shenzhenica TaxID=1088818 RepID=A0A2I0A8W6_9ASPA|nr:hypothetical protein AXF42_Ash008197 [Apostasia shenzhenica]